MIRSELVKILAAEHAMLSANDVESFVATFFDIVTEHLANGGRVELRGFGVFSTRQRDARAGRNPRTGASVAVKAKRAVHFKPGKEMRERVDR